MKFRILAGAVASVALFASAAAAQTCQGDLAFRGRPIHVGGALGFTDHTTTFGGGMTFGHAQGVFGGGSLGMVDTDAGNAVALGGGIGYSMPLQRGSKWQFCPGGTLSFGFGPSVDLGGTTMKLSTQIFSLGASFGRVLPLNKDVTMLPFGAAALGHNTVKASVNGATGSTSDTYLTLGLGAGFQFSPNFVVRPALAFNVGTESITDDTVFSLGISFALPR